MKSNVILQVLTICVLLFSSVATAQEFVSKMEKEGTSIYEIKADFDRYWEGRKIEKGKGWKQFQRWYHFWEPRVYPAGVLPAPDQSRVAMQAYRGLQKNNVPPYESDWRALGPFSWVPGSYSPGQGRVNGVTVDPSNPDRIYAGTPAGGLWISDDGGQNWTTTTDSLEALGVTSIVVDPFDSNIIYIASGDGDAADTYSLGVLKSLDGGQSWQPTGLQWNILQTRQISKLLIHPANSSILLAATGSGVYRTSDAGQNWTLSLSGNYKDIEFGAADPSIVYAAGTSFYRSTNNGQSFSQVTSGLPSSGAVNRLAIAVTPSDVNRVYVLAGSSGNSGFQGFYASTDGGLSFTQRANSPNLLGWELDGSDSGGQSWYDLAVAASPTNADEVFVGGVNTWKTTDGGFNWSINTHWIYPPTAAEYVHADIHFLDYFGNTLYSGCDGGIFKTDDGGANWIDLSAGIVNTQFYRMGGHPDDAALIVAGAQDNGSMRMTGTTWTQVFGADGMEAAIDYSNPNIMYVCYQNGGLLKSVDGGNNFFDISPGSGAWITPYLLDPENPQRIYGGFNSFYVSENGGSSWTQIPISGLGSPINHLAISPADNDVLYVGRFQQLFRSQDGGQSWQNIGTGLPFGNVSLTYVYASPLNADHVWATFSGYVDGQKVYRSTNGGETWENVSGSLPNLPANCVVVQKNLEQGVYVGTDVGVYYRNNRMDDWIPYFSGLPNVIVDELEIHEATGMLRAATFGRGIWESSLAGSGPFISHTPISGTEDPVGPYPLEAEITAGSSLLGSDIFVHYGYDGNVSDSIALIAGAGNSYSAEIPGPGANAEVNYYFSAADQEGFRNFLPIGAPQLESFAFTVGPDTIAPVATHQPIVQMNQLQPDVNVEVIATDERGIDSAFVSFVINLGFEQTFSLSGSDSVFSGNFPLTSNDLQIDDSISYTIHVRDGAINTNETVLGPFTANVLRLRNYSQQLSLDIPDNDPDGISVPISINEDGDYYIRSLEVAFQANHGLIGDLRLQLQGPDGSQIVLMDRPGYPGFPLGNLANDPDVRFADSAAVSIEDITFTTNETVRGVFRPDPDALSTFAGYAPVGDWALTITDNRPGFAGTVNFVELAFDLTNVVGINDGDSEVAPESYVLRQNYPNPFNPETTIEFDLPRTSVVTLEIFNNLGQLVQTPYWASQPAGNHKYVWNATDAAGRPVASGVYYFRITAGDFVQTRKMLLIR